MGRTTPLETRGLVAMMGNLGYELDLTNLSDEEKATIANQVNLYKELRPVVQLGQQYRLINPDTASNEAAVQFNYKKSNDCNLRSRFICCRDHGNNFKVKRFG